jgi:hypothetical protein
VAHPRAMAHKSKTQTEVFLAPLLVSKQETARLLGNVPLEVVQELIRDGHLQVRTLAGRELVKLSSIELICSERDPEPIPPGLREDVQALLRTGK